MMDTETFRIRNLKQSDIPYISKSIYMSWIHSPKNYGRCVHKLNNRIKWMLANCLTKVVCLVEDEDNIVGFVVCQPAQATMLIHCVFVRAAFRGLGIATTLLEKISVTHPDIIKTMDFCDDDLLVNTTHRVFKSVKDYSGEWENDRETE